MNAKAQEQVSIIIDITTRMAIFAMAKSCNEADVDLFFKQVLEPLREAYNEEAVEEFATTYKKAILDLREATKG